MTLDLGFSFLIKMIKNVKKKKLNQFRQLHFEHLEYPDICCCTLVIGCTF